MLNSTEETVPLNLLRTEPRNLVSATPGRGKAEKRLSKLENFETLIQPNSFRKAQIDEKFQNLF